MLKLERPLEIIFIQFLPSLGFILALLLLVSILRSKRSPASTFAWLLAIIFVPYLGVPAYLLFGGRKMNLMATMKPNLADVKVAGEVMGEAKKGKTPHEVEELFPARDQHVARLLMTGVETYNHWHSLLSGAKQNIYITTYVLQQDAATLGLIEVLTAKAKKGVEVCLLLDAVGCLKLKKKGLEPFKAAGGRVAFFMPMIHLPFRGRANLRNHRKMLLVDGRHAVIGGRNLGAEYMGPEHDPKRWKDLSLAIEGPIVKDLFSVFYSDWKFAASEELKMPEFIWTKPANDSVSMQLIPSGPDVSLDYLQEAIIESFFAARKRLWIVTPYFVPDETLLRSLLMAKRRGVDVRLYLPKKSNHRLADLIRRTYLTELAGAGVEVWFYVPTMLHAKLVVVDDHMAIAGSANMDLRSMYLNYEIGVMVRSERLTGDIMAWIDKLHEDCVRFKGTSRTHLDILEGIGRLLAPLV